MFLPSKRAVTSRDRIELRIRIAKGVTFTYLFLCLPFRIKLATEFLIFLLLRVPLLTSLVERELKAVIHLAAVEMPEIRSVEIVGHRLANRTVVIHHCLFA